MRYIIDPDITRAETLHASFYADPVAWDGARSRIFARSWHWLGDLEDVAEPESLSPRNLAPGLLDEPLLLARDKAGVLRCLSNVCTHRGNLLIKAPCKSADIRCGYHSRRFALDGRMTFMPEFAEAKNFPRAADHLASPAFGEWQGQAFASLDPAVTFADWIAPLLERMPAMPWQKLRFDPASSRDYDVAAHWALYVENYLEGFHIPYVHAGLNAVVDYASYRNELFPCAVLQRAVAKPGEAAFPMATSGPDAGERIAAYYWWLFPNLMLNFYPWGLSLNQVLPCSSGKTLVRFASYVGDASLRGQGAGSGLDTVEMEDEAIVEAVQRGVRSRLYPGGRYSPTREQGVHHFHRLLATALNDDI